MPRVSGSVLRVLRLPQNVYLEMIGLAFDELPNEACGLLGGDPLTGRVERFYPCRNVAESSRVYEVDPKDHLRADRDAEDRGPRDHRRDALPHPHRGLSRRRPTSPRPSTRTGTT